MTQLSLGGGEPERLPLVVRQDVAKKSPKFRDLLPKTSERLTVEGS